MAEVIGLFQNCRQANEAVRDLVENLHVHREQISILAREENSRERPAPSYDESMAGEENGSGAVVGAGAGAAIGGAGGLLAGIAGLALPGIGPIIAAGPMAAALAAVLGGAGIGAVTGGLIGALTDVGVPEPEARRYEHSIEEGKALIAVHADDRALADRVARVLDDHGALDLNRDEPTAGSEPSERPPYDRGEIRREQVAAERGDGATRDLPNGEGKGMPRARVRVYSRVAG